MKKYRVEIKALYYKDVEADSVEEAKKMVNEHESIELNDGGVFFYEPFDYDKLKTREE
tara:strand:+ start:512 stop:685 length:174 start_codon:yes stop_codon:yes gene_type:complete